MIDSALATTRRYIPANIFALFQPNYHLVLSFLAALWYGFPSRKITVIAVTGTKGKSSTVELISALLEEGGHRTALSNTIRFKIAETSWDNKHKMSMPGRFFLQRLIRRAVQYKCAYIVIEMTSQGAMLHRHRFINIDTLVFTNLTPEHIEAHGSYEKYRDSKLSIAKQLAHSSKATRTLVVNVDDPEHEKFLAFDAEKKITYSIHDVEPYELKKDGLEFTYNGRTIYSRLSGQFNIYNMLAAMTVARNENVSHENIIAAIGKFNGIAGRMEKIDAGQNFTVVVDYAHTVDSLEKVYNVYKTTRKICVLGGTGGGRDSWKRSEMGRLADEHCGEIILTDEDPYDEDPRAIIDDVAKGVTTHTPTIILDRREAIREALKRATPGDVVLITGKGTDPYIMGPHGSKIPWSDATIAREELEKLKL